MEDILTSEEPSATHVQQGVQLENDSNNEAEIRAKNLVKQFLSL